MKRILSIILSVAMLVLIVGTAYAENGISSNYIGIIANIPNNGNLRGAQVKLSDNSDADFMQIGGVRIQGNGDGTYYVTAELLPAGDDKFTSVQQVSEQVRINGEVPVFTELNENGGAAVTGFVYNYSGTHAMQMYSLGLVRGIGLGNDERPVFDLGSKASRAEAVTMLIRLLGKDKEAEIHPKTHPFNDVPEWADGYVSYAYENGLAKGVSQTLFDSYSEIGTEMYLTFLLRALGYSDEAGGDFVWDNPYALAKECGITEFEYDAYEEYYGGFLRAYMFDLSYESLFSYMKGTETQLYEKLISDGVFDKEEFDRAIFNR